ncbi:MAG: hypothetical protein ACLQU9_00200 [Acidimicrobiales bacterium]|jgi:hypothetical protein
MTHPELSTPRHLRRTKLIGAFAFALLVGVGSYTVTYHVLDLMSPPATVVGMATSGVAPTQGVAHAVPPPASRPAS